MNMDELDKLKAMNDAEIQRIENKYERDMKGIKNFKIQWKEAKADFQTKEYQKIASVNFPSYGRGLEDPTADLNTFMVQEKMCDDIKG